MKKTYQHTIEYLRGANWLLLLFLVLVLNVKLVIKVAAIILITLLQYKNISIRNILRHRLLYFYIAMAGIAILNYFLHFKSVTTNYTIAVMFGTGLWLLAAAAGYFVYYFVQNEDKERLYRTVSLFFMLHIGAVFLNFLRIIVETGSLNPYRFTGLNQKYYISTGDYIRGITLDSPVTTAIISAFGIIFFLYRRQYAGSLAAMASMLLIGSNLTNLMLAIVLLLVFILHAGRLQKSIIVVQFCLLAIFIAKVSPQNNEYVGRFIYKMIGKQYDLPKKDNSLAYIKSQPDSSLNGEELRKKYAQLKIDSTSAALKAPYGNDSTIVAPAFATKRTLLSHPETRSLLSSSYFEYRETPGVSSRIYKCRQFLAEEYNDEEKISLQAYYDWNKPGKWTSFLQTANFFRDHPPSIVLGAGIGNFSSRLAFKTTGLNIAGNYPQKFRYIHPWFQDNHLYTYMHYHAQQQAKHAAENTPDSTYLQLAGEYGIAGVAVFLILYLGYFLRQIRAMTFGIPILVLLMAAFAVEYWFEQLSIVILAELLLLLDIKSNEKPGMRKEEQAL